jgi:hypothetical protein
MRRFSCLLADAIVRLLPAVLVGVGLGLATIPADAQETSLVNEERAKLDTFEVLRGISWHGLADSGPAMA